MLPIGFRLVLSAERDCFHPGVERRLIGDDAKCGGFLNRLDGGGGRRLVKNETVQDCESA